MKKMATATNRKSLNDNFVTSLGQCRSNQNVCFDDTLVQFNKGHVESDHETQVSELGLS